MSRHRRRRYPIGRLSRGDQAVTVGGPTVHYAPDGRDLMARTLNIGDDDAAARSAAGDRLAAAAADAMARFAAARHLEPIRPWSELTETERDVIRAAVVALIGRRHRADLATLI